MMATMRCASARIGIVAFVTASAAGGQTAQSDSSASAARTIEIQEACTQGQASALSEIACELANELAAIPSGSLVASAPTGSTTPLKQPGRFERRLAEVVAGRLRRGAKAAAEAMNLAVARGQASGNGTLLHLRATIADGKLRVEADVYPVPAKFWDRVRDPRPSPVFHAFAERPLDAEVRSYLPPVQLVARETIKAKSPEHQPVALACADVDDDGSTELVIVGRRGIHLARIRQASVQPFASQQWTELSSVAPAPLREPIGSVAVHAGRYLDVGISDRAFAVRFDPRLEPIEKVGRRVPWPGGEGCSRFVGLVVGPQLHRCVDADDAPPLQTFGWGTDAIASQALVGPDGELHHYLAGRIANKAEVRWVDDTGRQAMVQAVGAQLALGDVDGDGLPELVAGTNTMKKDQDAVVVRSWEPDGSVRERLRVEVPLGVAAVAICPQPETRPAPIAVASGSEIWIVR
jgi:hypothetical protein